MSLVNAIEEFVAAVSVTGYRGLLVAAAPLRYGLSLISWLSGIRRRGLLVTASGEVRDAAQQVAEEGWSVVGQDEVIRMLGSEYDVVVVDAYGRLSANTIAAVTDMVRGGGVLAIVGPGPWHGASFGGWAPTFDRYFKSRVLECRQHLVVEHDGSRARVVSRRVVHERARKKRPPGRLEGLPAWLSRLVATYDQAAAIKAVSAAFEDEKQRTVLLLGNRGRGKSAALGLALAWLVHRRVVGNVPVLAPSVYSVQQLFSHLARGLRAAGIRYKAWGPRPLYEGVKGAWFKIYLESPHERLAAGVAFVDEAAALGVARLRRLAARVRKLVAATTVHGYEGSGRALAHRLARELPSVTTVELREPVRYPEGDPLEEWLYRTFMLDAEPRELEPGPGGYEVRRLSAGELADDYELLRSVYSVLALAHYRNMPSDLQLMLERRDAEVYALLVGGNVVSVAEVFVDDRLVADVLARSYSVGLPPAARIVRIATHPKLQRRGYGSRLLAFVESQLRGRVKLVGASFSNSEALGFWLKNGYAVVYISPRFNKVTGEKNYLVLKPLSDELVPLVSELVSDFRRRLVLAGSSLYRDVPAEVLAAVLSSCPPWYREPEAKAPQLSRHALHRLKRVISGDYPELAQDAAVILAAHAAPRCSSVRELEGRELIALTATVVQGKPVWEAADILGVDAGTVEALVRSALAKLSRAFALHPGGAGT